MIIRRRLISVLSAVMLVLSLFTLLPEGALTASAEGEKRLNIRVSYIAGKGQVHLEWDPYAEGAGYTLYFYNDCASGENAGQMLKMGVEGYIQKGGACEFTTREGFANMYAYGGMNYQVLIKVFDPNSIASVVYQEYSEVFRTGVPILPAPKNPALYINGLLTWEKEDIGVEYSTDIGFKDRESTDPNLFAGGASTDKDYAFASFLPKDKEYYARLNNTTLRYNPSYAYRDSEYVYSNAAVLKAQTGVLGIGWNDKTLFWAKYPDATEYRLSLQRQDPGGGFTQVEEVSVNSNNYSGTYSLQKDLSSEVSKYGTGVYRVVILAYNYSGERISDPGISGNITYTAPTAVQNVHWIDKTLYWSRFPNTAEYQLSLQRQDPGGGFTEVELVKVPESSNTGTGYFQKDLLPTIMKYTSGVYRVVILAYNAGGTRISDPAISETITYTKWLKGDVNHDGSVNRIDANLLSRYVAGWDDYEEKIFKDVADLNGDTVINRIDANILSRCVADWDGYRNTYIK